MAGARTAGPRSRRFCSSTSVDQLYADTERLHHLVGSAGFELPARSAMKIYRVDDSQERQAAEQNHGISISVAANERDNQLCIDEGVRAPKLKLRFSGSGNLGVFGSESASTGAITFSRGSIVVIAGGGARRVRDFRIHFHSANQRLFFGRHSSAEGLRYSARGDGVAVVFGEDCMLSWSVWVRPSDMHAIVDLETGEHLNPARDIIVEPHVWIGQEVLLLKGVRIGAGSIVGAKSLVASGVYPRMSIHAGNPATTLRSSVSWDREHNATSKLKERVAILEHSYPADRAGSNMQPTLETPLAQRVARVVGRLERYGRKRAARIVNRLKRLR